MKNKSNNSETNANIEETPVKKITAVGYVWTSPNTPDAEEIAKKTKDEILKYCKQNNIVFKKMFKDIGSTGNANKRPEMQEMFKYLERNKVDFLILDSLNSVGRRFHDAIVVLSEFIYRKAGLVTIAENIDTTSDEGKVLFKALLKIPQISQWTQPSDQKKKVRIQEILYTGGACPYGYVIDSKSNQYKIIEEEALVIRRIFRERMSGRSLRQIANDLSKDDIATKRGGKWQANTIKTILENSFYIGVYSQNGVTYKDCHDSIITEYIFNKVNAMGNSEVPVPAVAGKEK
mgnify:CR=1 FL=1